jgi:hypothetical protein
MDANLNQNCIKTGSDDFVIALRVLSRAIYNQSPSPRDINALRRNAQKDEMDLPIDELCRRVIHRALTGSWLATESRS